MQCQWVVFIMIFSSISSVRFRCLGLCFHVHSFIFCLLYAQFSAHQQTRPLKTGRPLEQTIFLAADIQTRPFSSQHTSRTGRFPLSRPPIQTFFYAADLQFRPFPTKQTSSPDHFPRSRPQIRPWPDHLPPSLSVSHKFAQNAQLRDIQVRSFPYGLGLGRLIKTALDEPCNAYYPPTFGLKSLDFFFGII